MTNQPNKANRVTENSEQYIENLSYDRDFNVSALELLGHDSTNNVLRRIQVDANGQVKVSGGGGVVISATPPDNHAVVWINTGDGSVNLYWGSWQSIGTLTPLTPSSGIWNDLTAIWNDLTINWDQT